LYISIFFCFFSRYFISQYTALMALLEESYSLLNPADEAENAADDESYPFVDKSTLRTKKSNAKKNEEPVENDTATEATEATDATDATDATEDADGGGGGLDTANSEERPHQLDSSERSLPVGGPAAPEVQTGSPFYLRLAKITLGVIVLMAFAYVVHWIGMHVFSYDISAGLWQRFVAMLKGCLDSFKRLFAGSGGSSPSVSPVPTAAAVAAAAAASALAASERTEAAEPAAVAVEPTAPAASAEADTAASQTQNVALSIKPKEADGDQAKSAVSETVVASVEHLLDDIATAH
jgi:hypothetical protein